MPQPVLSAEAITTFLDEAFPQLLEGGRAFLVETVFEGGARLRLRATTRHLRPGGTVSGPALFALADLTAYVAVLAHIGPVALAVTTNLSINFLRKPAPGDLVCDGRLLKLGRSLAVVDCGIRAENSDELVAHAVATYSIPPTRESGTGAPALW